MYSSIPQIQIIFDLLKQYNVRHIVISPGTRHVPLAHCCEIDSFFHCYSIVDERSAAYFALGLSEAIHEPVAFTCTSATATCNYMSAMKEAYERNIPLLALTADRARYQRFHGENQCIDQVNMYEPFVRLAVDLPDVKSKEDYWFCNRSVNEALIELKYKSGGPVQVNFLEPLSIQRLSAFEVESIPQTRKIDYLSGDINWDSIKLELGYKKRILVIAGQHEHNGALNSAVSIFANNPNVVISVDHFSNLQNEKFIHSPFLSEVMNSEEYNAVSPDLIITYGTKIFSVLGVKYRDRGIEHWHIDPNGQVYDLIRTQKKLFACTPEEFFIKANPGHNGANIYLHLWQKLFSRLDYSLEEYTNNKVVSKVLKYLPSHSVVHASVLNSMRLSNFYKLPNDIDYQGNICADGIDGALSSFLAQASLTVGTALLIIGDLSYLYDLNATVVNMPANVRILLINNYAGAEFHYNISLNRINTLNQHIAAGHSKDMKNTISLSNLEYRHVSNMQELEVESKIFFIESENPVLLECFTDAIIDGDSLRRFFNKNRILTKRNRLGRIIKKLLGNKLYSKIRRL